VAGWQLGLVVMMAVGVAVILFGALWDRERAKRLEAQLTSPPNRPIPGYAQVATPAYVIDPRPSDALSLALTDSRRAQLSEAVRHATSVRAGMMSPEFVSDPATGWAVLEHPTVLVCADRVETFRELLAPLQRTLARGAGLVVVAPDIAAEPLDTLLVNHLHRSMRILAVRADGATLATLARACHATPLTRSDLQAGWIPDDSLGRAEGWLSDRSQSWVLGGST
jgi:hypothetical protein